MSKWTEPRPSSITSNHIQIYFYSRHWTWSEEKVGAVYPRPQGSRGLSLIRVLETAAVLQFYVQTIAIDNSFKLLNFFIAPAPWILSHLLLDTTAAIIELEKTRVWIVQLGWGSVSCLLYWLKLLLLVLFFFLPYSSSFASPSLQLCTYSSMETPSSSLSQLHCQLRLYKHSLLCCFFRGLV